MRVAAAQTPGSSAVRVGHHAPGQQLSRRRGAAVLPAATAAAQQQHASSDGSSLDAAAPPAAEATAPLCVILPNGRQFQLQMVVRREGAHPTWRFAGAPGFLATATLPTVVVEVPPPEEQPQQTMPASTQHAWEQLQRQQQRPQQLLLRQQEEQQRHEQQRQQADARRAASHAADGEQVLLQLQPLTQQSTAAGPAPAPPVHDLLPWSFEDEEEPSREQPAAALAPAAPVADAAQALAAPAAAPAAPEAGSDSELLPWSLQGDIEATEAAGGGAMAPTGLDPQAAAAAITRLQQQLEQAQQQEQQLLEQLERAYQLPPEGLPLGEPAAATAAVQPPGGATSNDSSSGDKRPFFSAAPRAAAASPEELALLASVAKCRTARSVQFFVLNQLYVARRAAGAASGTVVLPRGWSAAVTAAALNRLRELLPWEAVNQLKAARSQQTAGGRSTTAASSSSSSSWRGPVRASLAQPVTAPSAANTSSSAPAFGARAPTTDQPQSENLKTAVRTYSLLMQCLELQAPEMPEGGLLAAALLAARLIGSDCEVHMWRQMARGYTVLGEAAHRLQAGSLSVLDAIQVCYSYSHSGYSPQALLQPLTQLVLRQPERLMGLSLRSLSHFTYCVSSCLKHLAPQLDQPALAAAVLPAVLSAGRGGTNKQEARAYDLVMLLRHMCQLTPDPPPGWDQELLPVLVGRMPDMTVQELCTVLHVACEWRLPEKAQLAAAAATLVAAAARVPATDAGSTSSSSDFGVAEAPKELRQVPVLLLEHAAHLRAQLEQQARGAHDVQQAAAGAGAGEEEAADTTRQRLAQAEAYVAKWAAVVPQRDARSSRTQPPLPLQQRRQLLPRNATDPVILLHRFGCCGHKPGAGLLAYLLKAAAKQLHKMSLLQGNLLRRALVFQWADARGCELVLDTCLQQWMCQDSGGGGSGSVLRRELLELPYWQLKALMVAAGRLGPLASEVQQEQQQAAQDAADDGQDDGDATNSQQLQQQQQAAHPSSSSHSDGGRRTATAFILAILQHLTPPVLAGWRADMVVALWWAAARLRLEVCPALLSAGGAALLARMRLQVAAREMPLLVWSAAVLQVKDAAFLEALCGRLAQCAKQLTPTSIASASWALAQLRCPNTAALGVLSRELLRPDAWAPSHAVLRAKTWQRPLQQQQGRHELQAEPSEDGWGSLQRPYPRASCAHARQALLFRLASPPRPDRVGPVAAAPADGCFVRQQDLLAAHPRVMQLSGADVSKLAASCCLAGWAPPQLFAVLAARALLLMPAIQAEPLTQLMWAFGTARCRDAALLHAAVERAAVLGGRRSYTASRQPLVLLGAFRSLGLTATQADAVLVREVQRLKAAEREGVLPA